MSNFPRTTVAGVSLPRMLIGTNWILGYSHTTSAADRFINKTNRNRQAISDIICAYMEYGIDAIMAPLSENQVLIDGICDAEDKCGKKIIRIDTPTLNVDNNEKGRKEAEEAIKKSASCGTTFCLPHHSSAEQLVCKNTRTIERLDDYTKMIRDNQMIPGLSCHMPELITYSDANSYDIETYIQIYNCLGYLMQVEIEYIHKVIWTAKKPVMTIKSMAAGRVSPFVGISFSYATIRPQDMVTIGAFSPAEVHEDVEIALAAIERRYPQLEGRQSPNNAQFQVK